MFSAALSSGHAGGSGTIVRFFGTLSLRGVPAGLVEDDQAVCAGRNGAVDLFEVFAHRCRVGMRHDNGGAGVTAWTDGTEQIGVFITLIFWLARTRALLGPLVDERVLLPDPHFIMEPHLDRGRHGKLAHGLEHAVRKTFF